MWQGTASYFYLPFQSEAGTNISARDQAVKIAETARGRKATGMKGIMITYSANADQSAHFHKAYASGKTTAGLDLTIVKGSNQAAVMLQLCVLLQDTASGYADLAPFIRIAPITTMVGYRTHKSFGDEGHEGWVARDLQSITEDLRQGWDLLLWVNTSAEHAKEKPRIAVGGGIVTLPAEIGRQIQEGLHGFMESHEGRTQAGELPSTAVPAPARVQTSWWRYFCCCCTQPANDAAEGYTKM